MVQEKNKKQNDIKNKLQNKPWYKYPMVWFVLALPLIAVTASIVTISLAVKHAPQVLEHNASYKHKNTDVK
ncbi:MAG TPA: hypothetical protein ENJ44_05235 [Oceanospirillales bacterium]|nr:hypothetical protein [Oceanospirillales bacterium]